jgi:hypothetical protein
MKTICEMNKNGFLLIRNGVMERIVGKTERPDVVLDEDEDHYYLNGVGVGRENVTKHNPVLFWNCNGIKSGDNNKVEMIVEAADRECAEMICMLDTRLDNLDGLREVEKIMDAQNKDSISATITRTADNCIDIIYN